MIIVTRCDPFYVPISLLLTSFPFSKSLIRVAYRRIGEGVFAEHGYLSGDYTAEVHVRPSLSNRELCRNHQEWVGPHELPPPWQDVGG